VVQGKHQSLIRRQLPECPSDQILVSESLDG
jgi:hypothetical protein